MGRRPNERIDRNGSPPGLAFRTPWRSKPGDPATPARGADKLAFWFREDPQRYLDSCLPGHRALVAQLDWADYKRNIVSQLLDTFVAVQHSSSTHFLL
jgi:hypothetical protein